MKRSFFPYTRLIGGCPFLKHEAISISRSIVMDRGISLGEEKAKILESTEGGAAVAGCRGATPSRPPPLGARVVIFHLLCMLIFSSRSPQRRSDTLPPAPQSSKGDKTDIISKECLNQHITTPLINGAVLPLKTEQSLRKCSRRFHRAFLHL